MEGDNNSFAASTSLFDKGVSNPLCNFAFLIGGAALQHRDLD